VVTKPGLSTTTTTTTPASQPPKILTTATAAQKPQLLRNLALFQKSAATVGREDEVSNPNQGPKGERGEKGNDGPRGPRGNPGVKGDRGQDGEPFRVSYLNTSVKSDVLTALDDSIDIVDGTGKIAFPLSNTFMYDMEIKQHPMGSGSLGTRVVLPADGAVYEYSFEVHVRNDSLSPQDIYVAVPVYSASGITVERVAHIAKQVPSAQVVTIRGTGLTYGTTRIWDGSATTERTFYLRAYGGTFPGQVSLPNGSGMSPLADAVGLYHSLTIKKISELLDI